MKVIGLCGGSGSGKGVVCQLFQELGIPFIDTDAVYRELTSSYGPTLKALSEEFGREIITEDNTLNRKALADIVFSGEGSEKRLKRLNEIAHKFILDETRRRLSEFAESGAVASIVDAPVLFESGFDKECNAVVCVIANRDIRLQRVTLRDGISTEEAERRIASQMSDETLIERCDFVIENNSDIHSLRKQVKSVIEALT